ncbi:MULTISPECIES: hypothetical protein [Arthrobacter]|uniref:Uncharacterized protein n=2 Tax=Arthrobacter TaxID=1663 RepID=A0ABU9KHP5_9MICC|nr:hypothetical protein [Arthrobacter sp. YJM1]MDP5225722.1 hypothetical protein [Arthrobacter sp. YJM1]
MPFFTEKTTIQAALGKAMFTMENHPMSGGGPVPSHPPTGIVGYGRRRKEQGNAISVVRQMMIGYAVLLAVGIFILTGIVITYDGAASFITWALALAFVPAVTLSVTAVLGLPLRLIPPVRRWWVKHWYLGFLGVLVGFTVLAVSFAAGHREAGVVDGVSYDQLEPDYGLALTGWLIISFFSSHSCSPPARSTRRPGPPDRPLQK